MILRYGHVAMSGLRVKGHTIIVGLHCMLASAHPRCDLNPQGYSSTLLLQLIISYIVQKVVG